MNFNKIYALGLRHLYLIMNSFPRVLDLIYWPTVQIFLWGFISKYDNNLNKENSEFLDLLVGYAINYYNDFIKPNKSFRKANDDELKAINALRAKLLELRDEKDPVILQNITYQIGNDFNFELRLWFQALYQILLGQDSGPRFGSFISLFGVSNMINLIDEKLN